MYTINCSNNNEITDRHTVGGKYNRFFITHLSNSLKKIGGEKKNPGYQVPRSYFKKNTDAWGVLTGYDKPHLPVWEPVTCPQPIASSFSEGVAGPLRPPPATTNCRSSWWNTFQQRISAKCVNPVRAAVSRAIISLAELFLEPS